MIPNIVHFNYGFAEQNEDFLFVYYIAVLSCKLINNPEQIYFYYHYEPKGYWWEKTKCLVELIKVDIPTHIGCKQVKKIAHKSDILRMEIIKKYGGIYLDIDTICIRSYKDLLFNNFVIANEITESGRNMGLCNAIMMSEPEGSFINDWYNLYETFFNPDGWQEASTILPFEMSKYNKNLTIYKPENFLKPSWERIDLIFEKDYDIPEELISLHYCNHYSLRKYLLNIKNFDWVLENSHTLYGKALLNILKLSPKLNEIIKVNELINNFTYKNYLENLNLEMFNQINNLKLPSKEIAIKFYLNYRNDNIYYSESFKPDIKKKGLSSHKVFFKNFDFSLDVDGIFVPNNQSYSLIKNNNYYKILCNYNNHSHLKLNQGNQELIIFNINYLNEVFIFPENFKITLPIKNIDIKPIVSITDSKFIINNHYLSDNLAYITIRRSDSECGWHKNLYLDVKVNNKNYWFYVGKSIENSLTIILNIDEKLEPVNLNYEQKIPKIVFQTWENNNFDTEFKNTIYSITEKNPEYNYLFFTADERREYIKNNYDKNVLFAYDNLIPGAFKADLFRYCKLYKDGGVYIDFKMIDVIPFRDFIKTDDECILVDDIFQKNNMSNYGFANGFICSIPKNKIFIDCINKIVENVQNKYYPNSPFEISGPLLLKNVVNKLDYKCTIFNLPYIGYDYTSHHNGIFDKNNNFIIQAKFKNYTKKYNGGSYINNFYNKNVYKLLETDLNISNNVFENIYITNKWGRSTNRQFYSGPGSDVHNNDDFINFIKNYIIKNNITSVTDCGCGDFRIFGEILFRLKENNLEINYNGIDISKPVIEENKKLFPEINFQIKNIIQDSLPKSELCIVRQVFQHLSNEDIQKAIINIKQVGFKHILICESVSNPDLWKDKKFANIDKPSNDKIRQDYDSYGLFLDFEPFNINGNELYVCKLTYLNEWIRIFKFN